VLIPSRSSGRFEMLAVERASARPLSLHGVLEIYMVLPARSSDSIELLAIERVSKRSLSLHGLSRTFGVPPARSSHSFELLAIDASTAWKAHREAETAAAEALNTNASPAELAAAITKADKAAAKLRDADESWQRAKAHLAPIEAHADLVEAAFPEQMIEAVRAARDARIEEKRNKDREAVSIKKTATHDKKSKKLLSPMVIRIFSANAIALLLMLMDSRH
jgi:hypothetical protein